MAGGQSLVIALNLQLSSPRMLIDITGIPRLAGITVANHKIAIGALITHAQVKHSA